MIDSKSGRTFRIHDDGVDVDTSGKTSKVRKKFEVQADQPTNEGSKKFTPEATRRPTIIPGTDREMLFTQQLNAYDCGPSMILNVMGALQVESGLDSVGAVRDANNKRRILANTSLRMKSRRWGTDDPALPGNGWFTNGDVDEILREAGLTVSSSLVDTPEARQRLLARVNALREGRTDFTVYSGNGRHYRAIYQPIGGQEVMLDSLQTDIGTVNNGIEGMINSAGQSDRTEFVSIAIANPTEG